ncbi:MAG: GuaB3 family IMP dehydrogenase-related protein [Firmicutes bacterium]|nr:GuaB3 family IMP dehydrogenase-related protein [Bacillota bacterium]
MIEVDIGVGKQARVGYNLRDITILPSRRTRDISDVDISWQLEGYNFNFPIITSPMDSLMSPDTAVCFGSFGGLGVLDLEGLWVRHKNLADIFEQISVMTPDQASEKIKQLYLEPVKEELIVEAIETIAAANQVACGAVSPKNVASITKIAVDAGLDILFIHGLVVSAEHLSSSANPLDLSSFVRKLDIPVILGGCASYQSALHLMRTGASAVSVGVGPGSTSRSGDYLGIDIPQATAIADVVGARTRHLEETGFYVQVIAEGGMRTGGDIAKAIACGADAVMSGSLFSRAKESPCKNFYFGSSLQHDDIPRGVLSEVKNDLSLREIIFGPVARNDGRSNLTGVLKRSMAMCGAQNVRELQKAELVVNMSKPPTY